MVSRPGGEPSLEMQKVEGFFFLKEEQMAGLEHPRSLTEGFQGWVNWEVPGLERGTSRSPSQPLQERSGQEEGFNPSAHSPFCPTNHRAPQLPAGCIHPSALLATREALSVCPRWFVPHPQTIPLLFVFFFPPIYKPSADISIPSWQPLAPSP